METNLELFDKLFSFIEREGAKELRKYLDVIDYFTAPASANFHLNREGGLLEHSLNVASTMLDVADRIQTSLTKESIVIVGLFHDLGKADYYGKPNYVPNILKSGAISTARPYETNKELLGVPHEVVAVQVLPRFIRLTELESHAIYFHNGLYVPSGNALRGKETDLQLLLHFADMWASRIIEE